MSNYSAPTFHPITGKLEQAAWMDDYYGHYEYGVRFPDGSVHKGYKCEQVWPNAEAEIKKLRYALEWIVQCWVEQHAIHPDIIECAEKALGWTEEEKDDV